VKDAPWMIRLLIGQKTLFPLVAAVTIAFPMLIAAFYLGQEAGWIPSTGDRIDRSLARLERRFADHDERVTRAIEIMAKSSRVVCENAARSPIERQNCQSIQ
jgi:hypothetical protein